jgi:hypothetical protein
MIFDNEKIKTLLKKSHFIYKIIRYIKSFDLANYWYQKLIYKKFNESLQQNKTKRGISAPLMGGFDVHIDELKYYELEMLNYNEFNSSELQSLKLLINENDNILVINPTSAIIILFLATNIKCNIYVVNGAHKQILDDVSRNKTMGTIKFADKTEDCQNYKLAIVFNADKIDKEISDYIVYISDMKIRLKEFDFALSKKHSYLWKDGRALIDTALKSNYILTSNTPYAVKTNKDKTKISGFSLLRNADIYPFDLCYESILEVVDEFLLFVDSDYPSNHGIAEESRGELIRQFIANSKYPEKIKIIDTLDFKARYCSKFSVPARWITDVNSYMIDRCQYDNCLYVMADEMFHEDSHQEILEFANQNKYKALKHYFLHFVWDLKHIRNPQNAAYTHAIRLFKKDYFTCIHDGFSFAQLTNSGVELINEAKYPVYHFGYIMDFRKKAKILSEDGGIFQGAKLKGYIEDIDTVIYIGEYPSYIRNAKMYSHSKIKHLFNEQAQ